MSTVQMNTDLQTCQSLQITSIHETDKMSSLQIAEITGKRHADVMRDIRNLLEQGVAERNFALSEYKDVTGRTLPCYYLTKKGCLILASGYDAKLREKIIDRWEELEIEKRATKPLSQLEILAQNGNVIICTLQNFSHLCNANVFNVGNYAKILSKNKKAAYGCKSRDFSINIECVSGDRLSFINFKTF